MKSSVAHPTVVLNTEQANFIQGGVSIVAASKGDAHGCSPPNLCKIFGCRVDAFGDAITVLVSARQAGALLADVQKNQKLAVVFCRPSTDQTLQIKTFDARVVPLIKEDYAALGDHTDKLVAEIAPLGFPELMVRPLFSCPNSEAVAIRFTPAAIFDQTPGPNAGAQVQGAS